MPNATEPAPRLRTRRACEPCRKKKIKCPGDRPSCSICARLNQTCSYSRRHDGSYGASRVPRTPFSSVRTVALVSMISSNSCCAGPTQFRRISESTTTLGNARRADPWAFEVIVDSAVHAAFVKYIFSNTGEGDARSVQGLLASPSSSRSTTNPVLIDLPLENIHSKNATPLHDPYSEAIDDQVVQRAAQVYVARVHCQPLPLFELIDLPNRARQWPQHLLLSFVALAARLSPDVLPAQTALTSRSCHVKARRRLMIELAEKSGSLEAVQSLCLLVIGEIGGMIESLSLLAFARASVFLGLLPQRY